MNREYYKKAIIITALRNTIDIHIEDSSKMTF